MNHTSRSNRPNSVAHVLCNIAQNKRHSIGRFNFNVIRNMIQRKSPLEKTAGKLISAIQKEWGSELGESTSAVSEEAVENGHDLLQAAKTNEVTKTLCGLSVTQYIGELWVHRHPSVKEHIASFERELELSENV